MPVDGTGRAATSTELGTIMAINAIFNANLFVAVNTNSRTWLSFLAVGGSNLMVIAWTVIFSLSSTSFLTSVDSILVGIGPDIWRYPTFYLTIVLVSVGCHLPRLTILYLRRQLYPTDIMLVQEMENRGIHKIHEEQLAKEEQAATLKRQSMAVATPSPLHHLHSIKKPQDSFAVVETIPEEQIQPISCETPSPEYDSTLNAESVLVDIQPVVSTSIAPIATISEGFQQQTLPISTHLEIEIPSNQAIQYQVNQEETQYQEKQQFDQDQPQQSFDQQQQQQLPSQPQHHVSFYVEPSSSVSPYQSTTITVTSPSPPPPPTLPLLIDSTSIAAAAVLTSSIDAEELTSVLQWASPTMSSSPPLSNSNSEYDGMHGINLTLMNNGMLYETRGFSFSESPGARDVIMGRTDIRHQSIVRRQSIMRKFSSTSLRNNSDAKSTRTVPNLRPRANTFTYGKRFGSLTDIAKSK